MQHILFVLIFSLSAFAQDIYQIKDKTIEGKDFEMSSLKDKVVLIVNVASQCGYTPQLSELQALYDKYKAKGFVILGVPTNDFGGQTPENDVGMKDFCTRNYNVTFPMLKKSTILGKEKRSLYSYLTEKSDAKFRGDVSWNFEKFLVNRKGEVIGRFKSKDKPLDKKIESSVKEAL
jgi:glutathione peroxidase